MSDIAPPDVTPSAPTLTEVPLNLWKREQLESARTQALGVVGPALKTISAAVERGNVTAAMQVVRCLGVLAPPKAGETDPKRIRRKRKVARHRKESRLVGLEQKYNVNNGFGLDTIDAWDKRLGDELADRDLLVWAVEFDWRHYESTLHMTEEECHRRQWKRPAGPPAQRRPSQFEALAAYERICISNRWDVAAKMNEYMQEGREAAEAAKGPGAVTARNTST